MGICEFCDSKFGDRKCYFCQKRVCTSCMTDDRTRCKRCYVSKKRLSWKEIIKKNKIIVGFVVFIWFYAVFPGPLIPGLHEGYYVVFVIAAIVCMIPLCLMMFFWSINPPASDVK